MSNKEIIEFIDKVIVKNINENLIMSAIENLKEVETLLKNRLIERM